MKLFALTICLLSFGGILSQTIQYNLPEENAQHEGTWLQWPHNKLYGPFYRGDVTPTFVAMTNALQSAENLHIIVYDSTEYNFVLNALNNASVPLANIDFFIFETDDVWSRDNGPMFVYDLNDNLTILDWRFNGWGLDAPYALCDVIPVSTSNAISIPRVDLSVMVLEGGAIEHDGNGTMMGTRSSITHSSRNPGLSESQIEDYMTTYMGFTKFIWLDGVYGQDITDMHIDGFVKFANDSVIVTMDSLDLDYWYVSGPEISTIYNATNVLGDPFQIVHLPLTQNNVITAYGNNLGYKGSYVNYYIANDVVLVPTYNDPNDNVAISVIQSIHPNRTAVGIDVRNLYEYGGMVHCVTQQQPVTLNPNMVVTQQKDGPILQQNQPNPFSLETTIRFKADPNSMVKLIIHDRVGRQIMTLMNPNQLGQFHISSNLLSQGIYTYSLYVDGLIVDTKKMIVK